MVSCFIVVSGLMGGRFVISVIDAIGVVLLVIYVLLLLVAIDAPQLESILQPQSITYVPPLQFILPLYPISPLHPTPYAILQLTPYIPQPHQFPSPPSPQLYPPHSSHPSPISLLPLPHAASPMPLPVTRHPATYLLVFPMPDPQRTS